MLAGRARCDAPAPRVVLQTGLGLVEFELLIDRAPLSCAVFLATVGAGAYAGGAFTRVVRPDNDHGTPQISVVQGQAARPTTTGDKPAVPRAVVAHESTRQTGLRHVDGTVSLPRDAVGTATGAEFFVCVGDQPALDFGGMRNRDGQGFAAFGRVVSGMAIVRLIWAQDASGKSADAYTAGQMLSSPVPIISARRA